MKILIIAAHPDDEVLGMGATIKKLSKKRHEIHLCVVTDGASAQYQDKKMIKIRKDACIASGKILGINDFSFLGFPDAKLDSIPQLEINKKIEKIILKIKPDIVYTISDGDNSKDHEKVFESALVAARPIASTVKKILSYEIPGLRRTPFSPNVFEDITNEIKFKNKAFSSYKSEIESYPHPRSIEAIENLAKYRGTQSGMRFAEAFKLILEIKKE